MYGYPMFNPYFPAYLPPFDPSFGHQGYPPRSYRPRQYPPRSYGGPRHQPYGPPRHQPYGPPRYQPNGHANGPVQPRYRQRIQALEERIGQLAAAAGEQDARRPAPANQPPAQPAAPGDQTARVSTNKENAILSALRSLEARLDKIAPVQPANDQLANDMEKLGVSGKKHKNAAKPPQQQQQQQQ